MHFNFSPNRVCVCVFFFFQLRSSNVEARKRAGAPLLFPGTEEKSIKNGPCYDRELPFFGENGF